MQISKTQVHIIYCHPSKNSITHSIKEGFVNALKENDVSYTLTDLYESHFKTDISEEEYLRENYGVDLPLSEDVLHEQEKINNSDILIFIFPLFWMDAPAKLVGYFSRVFTKGFKYVNEDNEESTMKTLKETIFLISAGSSYETLMDDGKIKALETLFIKDRMAGKTEKSAMYFFTQTTYSKEKELHLKELHIKKAKEIAERIK